MKKIIKPTEKNNEISLTEVSKIRFPNVGFIDNSVTKGFLIPDRYYDSTVVPVPSNIKYTARSVTAFSKGNGWGSSETRSLEGWFKFFGETGDFYLFDSPQDLFKWLSI